MIFGKQPKEHKPSLLIVDDEVSFMEMMRDYLEGRGFQVTCAPSGEAAIMSMRANRFKVVILDYQMPQIKGDDLIGKLQHLNPDARFLVVSGANEIEAEQSFRGTGYYAFMQKGSLSLERLEIVLRKAFQE